MKGEKIGFWKTLKTTKGAWKLLAVSATFPLTKEAQFSPLSSTPHGM